MTDRTAESKVPNPRRIFLDTCTIQAIVDCGGYIFEGEPLPETPNCQVLRRPDAMEIIQSLQAIFLFDERAMFDWVVSNNTGLESLYPEEVRTFMEHTEICLMEDPPGPEATHFSQLLSGPSFGFLSVADKALLVDAAAAGCDTFLTIENRLVKNAPAILRKVPLNVTNPQRVWNLLEPHLKAL